MNRLPPSTLPSVDECADRLSRAGWSAGDIQLFSGAWLVSATNGENLIHGRGESQPQAWWRAVEAARVVGMLRG